MFKINNIYLFTSGFYILFDLFLAKKSNIYFNIKLLNV